MPDDFTIAFTDSHGEDRRTRRHRRARHGHRPATRGSLEMPSLGTGATIVVVNMAAVTFIDSTGLHALLQADRALREVGGRALPHRPIDHHTPPRPHRAARPLRQRPTRTRHRRSRGRSTRSKPAPQIITELAGIVLNAASLRDDLERLIGSAARSCPAATRRASPCSSTVRRRPSPSSEHVALELDIAQYETMRAPASPRSAASGSASTSSTPMNDSPTSPPAPPITGSTACCRCRSSTTATSSAPSTSTPPNPTRSTTRPITSPASPAAKPPTPSPDPTSSPPPVSDATNSKPTTTAALVARAQGVLIATQHCSAEQARNLIHHAAAATSDSLAHHRPTHPRHRPP